MRIKTKNPRHTELANILRQARKDKGITQQEIAEELGISRETVVSIENVHKRTIETIEVELVYKWWHLCRGRATALTLESMKRYFSKHFI